MRTAVMVHAEGWIDARAATDDWLKKLPHAYRAERLYYKDAARDDGRAWIVTRGAQGSQVWVDGECQTIAAAPIREALDPTGCGDAYRAGLLYGIVNNLDWQTTGQLGSLMGSLKIARKGGQNHQFSRDEIGQYYYENFGARIF